MWENERGYSLIMTVGTIVFISILGLSLMVINVNSMKTSKHEQTDQSVFYVAEAGINYHVVKVEQLIHDAFEETKKRYNQSIPPKEPFEESFKEIVSKEIDAYIVEHNNSIFTDFLNDSNKSVDMMLHYSNYEVVFRARGKIANQERILTQTLKIKIDDFYTTQNVPGEAAHSQQPNVQVNPIKSALQDDPNYKDNTFVFTNEAEFKGNFKYGNGKLFPEIFSQLYDTTTYNSLMSLNAIPLGILSEDVQEGAVIRKSVHIKNLMNITNPGSKSLILDSTNGPLTIYVTSDFSPKNTMWYTGTYPITIVTLGNVALESSFSIQPCYDNLSISPCNINVLSKPEVNIVVTNGKHFNMNSGGNSQIIDANIVVGNIETVNINTNKTHIKGAIISLSEKIMFRLNGSANTIINNICVPYGHVFNQGTINLGNGSFIVNKYSYSGAGSFNILNGSVENACATSVIPSKNNEVVEYLPNQLSIVLTMIEE